MYALSGYILSRRHKAPRPVSNPVSTLRTCHSGQQRIFFRCNAKGPHRAEVHSPPPSNLRTTLSRNASCCSINPGRDHTARLWDVASQRCRQTFRGHVDSVNAIAWQPFTNNICTGSGDKTVSLWDARSGLCMQVSRRRGRVIDTEGGWWTCYHTIMHETISLHRRGGGAQRTEANGEVENA